MTSVLFWVPSEKEAWEPAELIKDEGSTIQFRSRTTGATATLPGPLTDYMSLEADSLTEDCENLVNLETYHEGIILHHIRTRFFKTNIYTFVGKILVAINPFKTLPIYGDEVIDHSFKRIIEFYKAQAESQQESSNSSTSSSNSDIEPIPHIFSISGEAYYNVLTRGTDQSVLISGESGAGKTEATKKILSFLSSMCHKQSKKSSETIPTTSIEDQILSSNPILEAFGNSKTLKNNNSSRFGKYIQIFFDTSAVNSNTVITPNKIPSLKILGCNITTYLLETSRVVKINSKERNYHIFYMFLNYASKEVRKNLSLKPVDQYNYLNSSGCYEIKNRNDEKEYEEFLASIRDLNIKDEILNEIFIILNCILLLGNLNFVDKSNGDEDSIMDDLSSKHRSRGGGDEDGSASSGIGGSKIINNFEIKKISNLLSLLNYNTNESDSNGELLERLLCNKENILKGEKVTISLNSIQASDQRDSLSKFLYKVLFNYIVNQINLSLSSNKTFDTSNDKICSISVLDIFGFEVFECNSLEQLCINYCNERLQTFFNEIIFENEMKLYVNEGMNISSSSSSSVINYTDNIGCVRLIDLKGAGIFAYLDEECTVPKGNETKFVSKLNNIFDENANTKSKFYIRHRESKKTGNNANSNAPCFIIRHFAGDVTYNSNNFLEKNRDTISENLISLLSTSNLKILKSELLDNNNENSINPSANKKKSLTSKFKNDLDSLMLILRKTEPHFIRCIKPNNEQVANQFNSIMILNQLKYSGLFEAIKIRKAGYEVRINHELFLLRYKCLYTINENGQYVKMKKDSSEDDVKNECIKLLNHIQYIVNNNPSWSSKLNNMLKVAGGLHIPKNKKLFTSSPVNAPPPFAETDKFVGYTKVFLKTSSHKLLLDQIKQSLVVNYIVVIQKIVRRFICVRRYEKKKNHLVNDILQYINENIDINNLTSVGLELVISNLSEGKPLNNDRKYVKKLAEHEKILITNYYTNILMKNERNLMIFEDNLSLSFNNLLKTDSNLYTRLKEAKESRIKKFNELRLSSAIKIQKVLRGWYGKVYSMKLKCEQLLLKSIEINKEEILMESLAYYHARVRDSRGDNDIFYTAPTTHITIKSTKILRQLQSLAQKLLLKLHHIEYVKEQLTQAIYLKSLPLLKDALTLTENSSLKSLKLYEEANTLYKSLQYNKKYNKKILNYITNIIRNNMCNIIKYYEKINSLLDIIILSNSIEELDELKEIKEIKITMKRCSSLYELKTNLRYAIEHCSPSNMIKLMTQRKLHCKLYGRGFLINESNAVEQILLMLKYNQVIMIPENIFDDDDDESTATGKVSDDINSINSFHEEEDPQLKKIKNINIDEIVFVGGSEFEDNPNNPSQGNIVKNKSRVKFNEDLINDNSKKSKTKSSSKLVPKKLTMYQIFQYIIAPKLNTNVANSTEDDDSFLPHFILEILIQMRNAENQKDLDEAIEKFVLLIPSEFHRKFYLRVFKWVLSFSSWLKEDDDEGIFEIEGENILNKAFNIESPPSNHFQSTLSPENPHRTNQLSKSFNNTNSLSKISRFVPKPTSSFAGSTSRFSDLNTAAKNKQLSKATVPFALRSSSTSVKIEDVKKKIRPSTADRVDQILSSSLKNYEKSIRSIPKPSTFS